MRRLLSLLLSSALALSWPLRPVECAAVPSTRPLSVILPAYNEAARIAPALDATLSFLSEAAGGRSWEVVVCDDGSTDGMSDALCERYGGRWGARLRLLRSVQNRGKGAALAAGAASAQGERVLLMDADGGTPCSALPLLEEVMDRTGAGVVCGTRTQRASRPKYRALMGACFGLLARAAAPGVRDTQCGFKLLSIEAARATLPHLRVRRWAYDVELLYLARRLGLGVDAADVPAVDVRGSKVRWFTPAQMALDVRGRAASNPAPARP